MSATNLYGRNVEFIVCGSTETGETILGDTWHPDGNFKPFEVAGTVRVRYRNSRDLEIHECQLPVDRVKFITTTTQLNLLDLI
jgi:hypothetical protein